MSAGRFYPVTRDLRSHGGKVDIYILARQEKLKSGNFGVDDVASEQTTTSVGICVVRDTTLILLGLDLKDQSLIEDIC